MEGREQSPWFHHTGEDHDEGLASGQLFSARLLRFSNTPEPMVRRVRGSKYSLGSSEVPCPRQPGKATAGRGPGVASVDTVPVVWDFQQGPHDAMPGTTILICYSQR